MRKAYLEDITGIESPKGGGSDMDENQGNESRFAGGEQAPKSQTTSRELSFLTDGGLELKLPSIDLKEKWKRYRAVIDAYLDSEGTSN